MKNELKQRLARGEVSLGSWLQLADTTVAEIMARQGFDWLTIDMEHSAIGLHDLESLIRVIEAHGCLPLVRLWGNDPVLAKRAMDAGAGGVIVPMVNTREEAERAVSAVKYPPDGSRGVGLYRAQGFGDTFEEYRSTLNDASLVVAQIEHRQAVENIEAILSVSGIDGVMIGPYDISGSLDVIGQLDHPKVREAQARVLAAAKAAGKAAGIHVVQPSIEEVKDIIEEGFTFIAYSTDAIMLNTICREDARKLRSFLDKGK